MKFALSFAMGIVLLCALVILDYSFFNNHSTATVGATAVQRRRLVLGVILFRASPVPSENGNTTRIFLRVSWEYVEDE